MIEICHGDCLEVLPFVASGTADLVYVDPPFNTGENQVRGDLSYGDDYGSDHDTYLAFLMPRLQEAWRILCDEGNLMVHLDQREVHYVKVTMDREFGHKRFMNEICWNFDYGGRPKDRWPNKHNTILWYAKNPGRHVFNYDAIDRIPYMAPGLVGPEKAARGKTPTDVWWQTIVPTNGKEKTGYPTQKPIAILNRIVKVHSRPGSLVVDAFAGSGTTGAAAALNGRHALMIDRNPQAIEVMRKRFMDLQIPFSGPI